MFIDGSRQLLESRSRALQELMAAWESVRLDFLCGKDDGTRMSQARKARREADANPEFFSQLEEAVLDSGLPPEVDHRLQALYLELMPCQGLAGLRERQDTLRTRLELGLLGRQVLVGGKSSPLAEAERLGEELRLAEERQVLGLALTEAAKRDEPLAREWLQLEHQACVEQGHAHVVEALAFQVGMDAHEWETWLLGLPTGSSSPQLKPGSQTPLAASLRGTQLLELLRDSAELLGLEVEAPLLRWQARPPALCRDFLGGIPGAEGFWPVALWEPRIGVESLRNGLELMGYCLGVQAAAVEARLEGEVGGIFPLRHLQARAFALVLASLPGHPQWATRLLEGGDADSFATSWRLQEKRGALRDLLRLHWLVQAPGRPHQEWDALWSSRMRELGLLGEATTWFQDAEVCLRHRAVLERVAARCLAATLLEAWSLSPWPEATPELGGHLLDELTDPPAGDWGEALDLCRSRLEPGAFRRWMEA